MYIMRYVNNANLKEIFVYKYDFYGFNLILFYMIKVTREKSRVAVYVT